MDLKNFIKSTILFLVIRKGKQNHQKIQVGKLKTFMFHKL